VNDGITIDDLKPWPTSREGRWLWLHRRFGVLTIATARGTTGLQRAARWHLISTSGCTSSATPASS
jgi:hypothetical protein